MNSQTGSGARVALIAGAVAALSFGALAPGLRSDPPSINVPFERKKLKNRKKKGNAPRTISRGEAAFDPNWSPAHGSTLKKMRRMVRANPDLMPVPTIKSKMRHKWFQKLVAAAALRTMLGQALPGDAAFLREVSAAK